MLETLVLDEPELTLSRTTFMVDDWVTHTPIDILAKNFGVNESVFKNVPPKFPYILNATVSSDTVSGGSGPLVGNSSFVYHAKQHALEPVPGGGGTHRKVDSSTFPIAKTIAANFLTLEPKGLRELHWHPNVRHHPH
jgi:oxalate decarboxylase